MSSEEKKIYIVGGGFGGIKCALELSKKKLPNTKICLISDKFHFEYHAALYRVVTGKSPLEVCIAIPEIIKGTNIEFIEDKITRIDVRSQTLCGDMGCEYKYNYLVLGLGSETTYFGIPGLQECAFGFKTIHEALALKRHLHETFSSCNTLAPEQQECHTHLVVVGGGASGVELSAELAVYTKKLAGQYNMDPKKIKIDLIERAPRLLSMLSENVSGLVESQLEKLGVNVMLNQEIVKSDIENIYLKDMQMKTKTVVWTAGVAANHLYEDTSDMHVNKQGKVEVDPHLRPPGLTNVFVIGDGAATKYSGMATTAFIDGSFAAENIYNLIIQKPLQTYSPVLPPYIIPVGPGWAVACYGNKTYTGNLGWFFRRWFDFKVYLSLLPLGKAVRAFREGQQVCQTCHSCEPEMVGSII